MRSHFLLFSSVDRYGTRMRESKDIKSSSFRFRNLQFHFAVKLIVEHSGIRSRKSQTDPADTEDVISIAFMDEAENVLYKSHPHEDGTHNTIAVKQRHISY